MIDTDLAFIEEPIGGYYPPVENGGGSGGGIVNPPAVPIPTGTGGTNSGVFIPNLAISPNTEQRVATGSQRCFTAVASASIPEEAVRHPDFETNIVHGCVVYNPATGYFRKNCGANAMYDTEMKVAQVLYKFQPGYIQATNYEFNTPGGATNNSSCLVGLRTTTQSHWFCWEVIKYCNATILENCNTHWLANIRIHYGNTVVIIATIQVFQNENFRVRTTGQSIIWERQTAGVWVTHHSIPIPSDVVDDFYFIANAYFLQNTWTNMLTYRGSWQGNIAVNWSAPDGGTLTGTGNTRCFSSSSTGTYRVCAETEFNDQVCVNVAVESLYFKPKDGDCGDCVFSGEIVEFESNASGGVLTSDIGTIINNNRWLVPTPQIT